MFVSVLTSLLVPKVLGVEGFGYWQLFLFYASYMGFFQLGLNDGVYLINGGIPRGDIDQRSVSSQMRVGAAAELIIALAIAAYALMFGEGADRTFVLLAVAVFLPVYNVSGYLGYLFQAMNETRLFSRSTVVDSLAFALPLLMMLAFGCNDFRVYVAIYLGARILCLAYCVWEARDILRAQPLSVRKAVGQAWSSVRVGFRLMVSNIASMFVLGVLRWVVEARWGIASFSELSLSMSLTNFFLTFVNQGAMVLFPALRRSGEKELAKIFSMARDCLSIIFPSVFLLYVPMAWLVSFWLPQYAISVHYLAILLPVCTFDARTSLLGTTYMKVLRGESDLLKLNLATAAASAVGVLVGAYCLQSIEAAAFGAVIAIMARSVISEYLVSGRFGGRLTAMTWGEIGLALSFIALTLYIGGVISAGVYALLYGLYLVIFRKKIFNIIRILRKNFLNSK